MQARTILTNLSPNPAGPEKPGPTYNAGQRCLFITASLVISWFYKDQLETNILQLFAHPENSGWFSGIFVIIFEVNIAPGQKQA